MSDIVDVFYFYSRRNKSKRLASWSAIRGTEGNNVDSAA